MLYILTSAIHSGKTTALQNYTINHPNGAGILCPDAQGMRYCLNIETLQTFKLQKNSTEKLPEDILVGKYCFDGKAMQNARDIIENLPHTNAQYFIIDEIGKLELEGKGLEPAFTKILPFLKNTNHNVIIIVRDYLINEVITKYNLNAIILTLQDFKIQFIN